MRQVPNRVLVLLENLVFFIISHLIFLDYIIVDNGRLHRLLILLVVSFCLEDFADGLRQFLNIVFVHFQILIYFIPNQND